MSLESQNATQTWGSLFHAAPAQTEVEVELQFETAWRLGWKSRTPAERYQCHGFDGADIELAPGVVALQEGPLTAEDLHFREATCSDVIWLVNAQDFELQSMGDDRWRWSNCETAFLSAQGLICFDLGDNVLVAEKLTTEGHEVLVHGHLMSREEVAHWFDLAPF